MEKDRIIEEHLQWLKGLIDTIDGSPTWETVFYVYKTAMEHGWKHCYGVIAYFGLRKGVRHEKH